eukprot:988144-Pelagomonas_calceolata.AAC.1
MRASWSTGCRLHGVGCGLDGVGCGLHGAQDAGFVGHDNTRTGCRLVLHPNTSRKPRVALTLPVSLTVSVPGGRGSRSRMAGCWQGRLLHGLLCVLCWQLLPGSLGAGGRSLGLSRSTIDTAGQCREVQSRRLGQGEWGTELCQAVWGRQMGLMVWGTAAEEWDKAELPQGL